MNQPSCRSSFFFLNQIRAYREDVAEMARLNAWFQQERKSIPVAIRIGEHVLAEKRDVVIIGGGLVGAEISRRDERALS